MSVSKVKTTTLENTTEQQAIPHQLLSNAKAIWGANKKFSLEITTKHQTEKDPQYVAALR
jgi:hypothetical protein